MQKADRLYRETLIRVGKSEMQGVDSLLDAGHTGIAERHTVEKLMAYVRKIETELKIDIPKPEKNVTGELKVCYGNTQYFI